jgi:CRISPR/Cas system-associated endoribonuclease Cas2
MAYLLIYDLNGRSPVRWRLGRYLRRNARPVQQSVWKFNDLASLRRAAGMVMADRGKVLAFSEDDRILLATREMKQFLSSLVKEMRPI